MEFDECAVEIQNMIEEWEEAGDEEKLLILNRLAEDLQNYYQIFLEDDSEASFEKYLGEMFELPEDLLKELKKIQVAKK